MLRHSFHWSSFSSSFRGGGRNRLVALERELEELAVHFADLADAPGIQHLLGLDVDAAIALLETESDVLLAVRAVGDLHDALAAGDIEARGLLHVDMLAGLDRGLEVLRMQDRPASRS